MAIRREPASARLIQDLARAIVVVLVGAAMVAAVRFLPPITPSWLDTVGRIVGALFAQLLTVALLRGLLPRPKTGAHIVGRNRAYASWIFSQALVDIALNDVVRTPFWFFHSSRYLYLRALGASLSWTAGFSRDLYVRDPSLLKVAKGALIEPGVRIETGVQATGRIRVEAVNIGAGALIGENAVLMPGCSLGHDARVGPGAYVGENVQIGVSAKVGPRAVLARRIDVGSYVTIGPGAVISDSVRIADHAKVLEGAVIPPHTRIREREVWGGVPARPLYRGDEPKVDATA